MVRIILGAIDIEIHLVTSHEIDEIKTHLVRPWRSVKAFDHTAKRQGRVVTDRHYRQVRPLTVFNHLAEGLKSIKDTCLVKAGDIDGIPCNLKTIGSGDRFNVLFREI